jgi:DNA polymerase
MGSPDSAVRFLPPDPADRTLPVLRRAAAGCTACPLHLLGRQTVFGEGPPQAPLLLVGEQPGDREDLLGRPFVGPAGQLLDRALGDAGLDRGRLYVTNVVKHFKWVPRGKRRLHAKPGAQEISACLPWLEAEIVAVNPTGVVCLGATAAQALLGAAVRVTRDRGRLFGYPLAGWVLPTVHPSALLRIADDAQRREAYLQFVSDLARAVDALAGGAAVAKTLRRA